MSTVIAKNVQVGTSGTAAQNFTLYQPASPDGTVRLANGNSGSTTDLVTVNSSGNVGVGTSSPSARVHAVSAPGTVQVRWSDATNGTANLDTASGLSRVWSNVALAFGTGAESFTERARIDSSGNLLVGTTSGSFHVLAKTLSANYSAGVFNSSSSAPYGLLISLNGVTGGAGGGFLTCADNANRLLIAGNGNVTNVNNSYGAISDAKLKENIVDATPKLEKLNQVRVVNFNMIGDEQKQIGVIAQELEQIFPGMVEETPDRDAEGNDLGTTTKSVKYSVFVPMLVKAIQEQQALITSQQEAITALTSRITALEN